MKKLIKFFSLMVLFFVSSSESFSQLNGTYTIGGGGNFATINSAVSAAASQGVSGPVLFDILAGTYNEETAIDVINGTSAINTITFRSQTGNPNDVVINGNTNIFRLGHSSYLIFRGLTLGSATSDAFSFDFSPDNITIEGNKFNGNSIGQIGSLTVSNLLITGNSDIRNIILGTIFSIPASNLKIMGNSIDTIRLNHFSNILIEKNIVNNYIYLNGFSGGNINKNKIHVTSTIGFSIGSCKNLLIYNNFFTGATNSNTIFTSSNSSSISLIYNTFVFNSDFLPGSLIISNLDSNYTFLNNLFICLSGQRVYQAINVFGEVLLSSDYNDYYNGGNINLIYYGYVDYNTVADFFAATGFDQHSNSRSVNFVSGTDLHLAGSSIGDIQLAGIPTPIVTDDIDGQPRNPLYPYKGADEPEVPLPVELSSFTSSVINNNVTLLWTTISETNNSRFDIERKVIRRGSQDDWINLGFVNGVGNSNAPQNYFYEDKTVNSGKYNYRLKQIDYNGNFKFNNLSNEVVIAIPIEFKLSQNYPNPFNPGTTINYSVPNSQYVILKVYNMTGKEVLTLVNETKDAGSYSIEFDGSNLPSGMYFYKMKAGAFNDVKMMLILK
jgi:hypothetical protein